MGLIKNGNDIPRGWGKVKVLCFRFVVRNGVGMFVYRITKPLPGRCDKSLPACMTMKP